MLDGKSVATVLFNIYYYYQQFSASVAANTHTLVEPIQKEFKVSYFINNSIIISLVFCL